MSVLFTYVTVPSDALAQEIASTVVSERLAACANIIPGMKSVYQWQGRIEQRDEIILILKTQEKLFKTLEARVKALHSDETPCIVALPVTAGNAGFLQWITSETTNEQK
jgi:periplasmic divalent cation tolerance protein